jgi:hypothetical protein
MEERMKPYHVICGGEIIDRQCQRCKKKWSLVSYMLTPNEIRVKPGDSKQVPVQPSKWTAKGFASHLPKWPRWARILTVAIIIAVIVVIIILIRR